MKLRSVLLVIFAAVVGAGLFPSPLSAENYALEAVPLYQPMLPHIYFVEAFVTSSQEESIAWENKGWKTAVICYVSPAQIPGSVPFMRLFNPKSGDHLCTISLTEAQAAIAQGFTSEGILGYVFPKDAKVPGTVPLHRFYIPGGVDAYHIYSPDEHAAPPGKYGNYEGIACLVWAGPTRIANLTITAPRPGESLVGGGEYEVQWSASAKTGAVSIDFSGDSGYSWTASDCGLPNMGFTTWRVPNIDTNRARMRITWTDAASGPTNVLAIAESEADLSIKKTPFAALPSKTFQAAEAPTKPTGVKAEALPTSEIRLSWQVEKRAVKGYLVERRTGREPFRPIANVLAPAVAYTDSHISPGTSYAYRVRAYGDGMSSGYSDVVSVKTKASLRAAEPSKR